MPGKHAAPEHPRREGFIPPTTGAVVTDTVQRIGRGIKDALSDLVPTRGATGPVRKQPEPTRDRNNPWPNL